jgi:branched-chain amino acid transport system permease protein
MLAPHILERLLLSLRFRNRWWWISTMTVLLFIPTLLGEFWVNVATEIVIMSIFALSFNLLFGYTGRLSFGQAAYLGVGGYTSVILYNQTNASFFICAVVGILAGGLWALLAGLVCNRLSGIYFAIMTIVVAQATFYIAYEWYDVTGGSMGVQVSPPAAIRSGVGYYLYTLALAVPAILALWHLIQSPFGRSLKCIRDNADKSLYVGIDVKKVYLIVFVIAGLYAALAGVLWAPLNRTMTPGYCGMMKSGDSVFMAVLGGVYTFLGPIVGAVIWTFIDVFISRITQYWFLFMGLTIMLVVMFMKGGILGTIESRLEGFKYRRRGETTGKEEAAP